MTALRWMRVRLFPNPKDTLISLLCLAAMALALPHIVDWALIHASWSGDSRADCAPEGACWAFIRARFGQFIYGLYPEGERWRANIAGIWLILLILCGVGPRFRARGWILAGLAVAFLPTAAVLLLGGLAGLAPVETREWGGLMLTIVMAVSAAVIALPLGIVLALARTASLPVLRACAVGFIEFWRGIPIITVIFLASILLPLVLPTGINVDKLLRAIIGLGLVVGAYMAEVVRGGLQAIPEGQREAAKALGLDYWRTTGLIVLPQALRVSIPGLINEFIALLKNTSLVLIVSLFDLLGIVQAALGDPRWVGLTAEAYSFAGIIFWFLCFAISRYGRSLEARLRLGER